MTTVSAVIGIDAAPLEVWAVLADLSGYHEWNPLFVEAAGDVVVGQRVTLRSKHPANGRLMTVKPKITVAEPGTELRWTSSLPGIIAGEHSFTLTPVGNGTRVAQEETYRGLLARFSNSSLAKAQASFQALNQALKERAESRASHS